MRKTLLLKLAVTAVLVLTGATCLAQKSGNAPLVTQAPSGKWAIVLHGGAGVILRGIRAISDYEYELQMALMNRKLEPRLETVFMLPGESYSYLSSKLVREIAQLGGPLKDLVPPEVEQRLRAKVL